MAKRSARQAKQAIPYQEATATQAGIKKGLVDELTKGHEYAAKTLVTPDEQQQLTLLAEAEIAYQNALYLIKQVNTIPSYILQNLQQLGTFLEINDQEGN